MKRIVSRSSFQTPLGNLPLASPLCWETWNPSGSSFKPLSGIYLWPAEGRRFHRNLLNLMFQTPLGNLPLASFRVIFGFRNPDNGFKPLSGIYLWPASAAPRLPMRLTRPFQTPLGNLPLASVGNEEWYDERGSSVSNPSREFTSGQLC